MLPSRRFLLILALTPILTGSIATAAPRDPTQPPPTAKNIGNASEASLNLTSILVGGNRRHAIINDRRLAEGDVINDLTVLAIENRSVSLKGRDGQVTLMLDHTQMKSHATGADKSERR